MSAAAAQPKKPQASYFLFINEKRESIQKELGCKDLPKVAKRAGELWKSLSEEDKKPYEAKHKALKEQFEKDMEEFTKNGGVVEKKAKKGKADKVKKIKDEHAPKKPQSGYFIFVNEKREDIFKENKDKNFGKMAKRAGELWKSLSEAEKEPYEKKAQESKADYASAMEEYEKSESFATVQAARAEAKAAAKASPAKGKRGKKASADSPAKSSPAAGKRGRPADSATPNKTSPAAKKGRKAKGAPEEDIDIDADVLKAAGEMAGALKNLAKRPEPKGKSADALLKILKANDGLVNKAKAALAAAGA